VTALLGCCLDASRDQRVLGEHGPEVPRQDPGHSAASERDHLRAAAAVAEEAYFTEEVARAEMSHLLKVVAHLELAVEDHEELVGVVALVDQSRTRGQLGLLEPAGTAFEVGIRQPVEQA
jgi:hypothetical protein